MDQIRWTTVSRYCMDRGTAIALQTLLICFCLQASCGSEAGPVAPGPYQVQLTVIEDSCSTREIESTDVDIIETGEAVQVVFRARSLTDQEVVYRGRREGSKIIAKARINRAVGITLIQGDADLEIVGRRTGFRGTIKTEIFVDTYPEACIGKFQLEGEIR